MSLSVNGADRDLAAGTTIADLVADVAGDDRGVAVAVDGVVLPRDKWDATVGDLGASAVDILNAVQGG
ncbi:MAG TPA: sulfur carrier protein ThiS [Actinomycetales bacterium]|nr:sulfur carrier protein ThiS [Actinomycetales bacterium]